MIKFFRHIRQRLIQEKNMGKYLKYAIGEILLVVIGILIAIQINNWNENRKKQALELELLKQVNSEIESLEYDVSTDLTFLKLGQRSHDRIFKAIRNNAPYTNDLVYDFLWLKDDEYIYPKSAAYDKIKMEGLELIKDGILKDELQLLYESYFPRISKDHSFYPDIELLLSDYYIKNFIPNYDTSITFFEIIENDTIQLPRYKIKNGEKVPEPEGYIPLDFEKLKKDTEFLMLLKQAKKYRDYKIRRYNLTKEGMMTTKRLIELRLNKDKK
jgi:hypothetical protein